MNSIAKKVTVVAFASAALLVPATSASAANNANQDGLVNVSVGDIDLLNNARVGVAAQVAATVCGVKVGPVAVLGTAVDASGTTSTVCTTDQGPVTISQN